MFNGIFSSAAHQRPDTRCDLCELRDMFDRHIADIADGPVSDEELVDASVALRHLEQFWTKLLAFGTRVPVKIKAA